MMYSLTSQMAKFMTLGMSLESVIDAATEGPAVQFGAAGELGCLLPGTAADITVLTLEDREMLFHDKFGNKLTGKQMFVPQMTVIGGNVLYQSMMLHP